MISINAIADALNGQAINADAVAEVVGVTAHTGSVASGFVFVAIRGVKDDGHQYLGEAFDKGASLAVVEDGAGLESRPHIIVPDTRIALSRLASLFAGEPTKKIKVLGVTGTNGKTTTHWMIAHLLTLLGEKVLRIGTIGVVAPDFSSESSLTTPDPVELHKLFARAADSGCTSAVMEVSSHALHQHRVDDVCFDVAVFSNLTRDHLDYHKTMEAYAFAKGIFFELLGGKGKGARKAIINRSTEWGEWFLNHAVKSECSPTTFGHDASADLQIRNFAQSIQGSSFTVTLAGKEYKVKSPFIGAFNAENLVSSIAAVAALGYPIESVIEAASKIPQVSGRLESCGKDGIGVYVDYAHTPDALHNALAALKPVTKRKLWVVFGCGGDRDKGKRPQMALVAQSLADAIVVTSDNPRTEDPQMIINDILASGIHPEYTDVDREAAIRETISRARPGDIVLIAGKGHENYQILGTTKIHFSDQEIVHSVFRGPA